MTGREALSKHARRELLLFRSWRADCLVIFLYRGIMKSACRSFIPKSFSHHATLINRLPFAGRSASRCPWCAGKLGFFFSSSFNPARLACCFHCGSSLNDMLATDGKPKNGWLKKPASWQDESA